MIIYRESLLLQCLKNDNFKGICKIFSHQILREHNRSDHNAVIKCFAKDTKGKIDGAIVYFPNNRVVLACGKKFEDIEEKIPLQDLCHKIIISHGNDHFHPFITNRNDVLGATCRAEVDNQRDDECPHYCQHGMLLRRKLSKKNNNNHNRGYWSCPKKKHDQTKCKYFVWDEKENTVNAV